MRAIVLTSRVPGQDGRPAVMWENGKLRGDPELSRVAEDFLKGGGDAYIGGFGTFQVGGQTEYHAALSLIYFLRWVINATEIRNEGVTPRDPDGVPEGEVEERLREADLMEYRPEQPRDWRGRWMKMGLDLLDLDHNLDWQKVDLKSPVVQSHVANYEDPGTYEDMQLAVRSPEVLLQKYQRLTGFDYPLDRQSPKGRGFDTKAGSAAELRAQALARRARTLEQIINNRGKVVDGKQFYRVTSLDHLPPEVRVAIRGDGGGGIRLREPGFLSVTKSIKEARKLGGLTADGKEGVLFRIMARSSRAALRLEDVDLPGRAHSRVGEHVFAPGAVLRFRGSTEEDGITVYEVELID